MFSDIILLNNHMEQLIKLLEQTKSVSITQYCSNGAVQYGIYCTFILGTICFILTKITHQYSWVDRIWPVLPIAYGVHYLYHQNHCRQIQISSRQWIMIILTSLWGCRLQFNFFRKGGFAKGGQDYRWVYIRKNYHWILVQLLNFFFTAYYQLFLIMWFATPINYARQGNFNLFDLVLTLAWLSFFVGQVVADEQQWTFQNKKRQLLKDNKSKPQLTPQQYRYGFVFKGLFNYTRHPNFFCQISIWYVQFLFSYNSIGLNYSGLGAVLLNLLFLGSTALTEKISSQKYPMYKVYQKYVSMLIPTSQNQKLQQIFSKNAS